ncbi:triphosphoribosyl-dephospho-CoA synthase [Fulvimarina sp. 2208YS6-2-32]|uniref:Triphosphoribosyl-dephospho-CoA synthase n=1 Tax=Fulvimarina uroteuthidis TaxID=3098149 RepID=A0ABU5HYY9_9HYPH|nr:triphosphoribosyl-dephospho-CoA synthase [Fulvimarina sp. 2208YS6-2-32]MDY8108102.1 triphosphoribosyl-dephospho-CoA synthase [Fulvimarina sp. 2208YS6-2-32]
MASDPRIEAAFLAACRAELCAIKPGNVHIHAPGHAMDAATFERAALAAAPLIADAELGVGDRVLQATRASFEAAGCNANLGIVLLAVPIARAFEVAETAGHDGLRSAIGPVLAELGDADARQVFAAIAHASPGGLGEAGAHDVRQAPTIGLVDAMRLAQGKDRIARQYATGFADLFATGRSALAATPPAVLAHPALGPAFAVYGAFTVAFPDSHIARKFGVPTARAVQERFAAFFDRTRREIDTRTIAADALRFDAELKGEGLNPGTSADLTVATLFLAELCGPAFFAPPLRNVVGSD